MLAASAIAQVRFKNVWITREVKFENTSLIIIRLIQTFKIS